MPHLRKRMLPKSHHELDVEFIQEQINMLEFNLRARVCDKYTEVFDETYENTPICYQKSNRARREANIRLRNFVSKYAKASLGETIRPPTV